MQNLKQKLIEFGLFEPEAEAYLRLLKIGEGSVEKVADQSFDFADALVALDSLADKNLVEKTSLENTIYYKVNDPENVLSDLKIRRARAKIHSDNFQKAMMNLDLMFAPTEPRCQSKNYFGYGGVLEVRKKIFEKKHDNIYNITSLHETLPKNHIQSLLGQVEAGYYLLIPKSDIGQLRNIGEIIAAEPKLQIRTLDQLPGNRKSEILIFSDTTVFGDIDDQQLFTVIDDASVASIMSQIFMMLWRSSATADI
ncbi:MAG: hypothetical protein ACOZBH_01060 [Patescibacteria group bacterium]